MTTDRPDGHSKASEQKRRTVSPASQCSALIGLTGVNAVWIAYLLVNENLANETKQIGGIVFACFALLSLMGALRWLKIPLFVAELQITVFVILCFGATLQFIFGSFPGMLPDPLRTTVHGEPVLQQRERVVEYLPYSPFAKPKPDVIVTVPGYYGPPEGFVYRWRTDRRGFKNLAEVADRDSVPIVAIGDSFTEGLGVRVEDTWASLLTRAGFVTYNLGVQGYAPTQMAGTFEHYGAPLQPKYVIIGYLGGVHGRETFFLRELADPRRPGALPSAIGRLVEADTALERRKQYRFVAIAIARYGARLLQDYFTPLTSGVGDIEDDPRFTERRRLVANSEVHIGLMQRYRGEIRFALESDIDPKSLPASPEWQSTLRQFDRIIELARSIDAQVVIMMLRSRGYIYAQRATGVSVSVRAQEEVERRELEKFAVSRQVGFIDTTRVFLDGVARIEDTTPISDYPYLPIDGHPSPVGHGLIADRLARYFRSQGHGELK